MFGKPRRPLPPLVQAPIPKPIDKPIPVLQVPIPLKIGTFRLDIKFETGKALLLKESEPQIIALADFMKQHPELIPWGVAGKRISAAGRGSSQPTADNTTLLGRQENRRVVATLTTLAVQ